MSAFRVFVAGTDTGVGKTEAACALARLLARAGAAPSVFKPYESGVAARGVPADARRLRRAAGDRQRLESVCLHRFRAPLAPGVAAAREGRRPDWGGTLKAFRALGPGAAVVEGAGGLRVPLDDRHDVVDLARALRLPVLLVARAGLGTLNHTALSLEALERRRVQVLAVLLVASTPGADPSVRDNPAWLRRRHPGVLVLGPVPFGADATRRDRAYERALRPLLR